MSSKVLSSPPGRSPSRLIEPRGRFWAVHDPDGQLVCVTVYKRGANEVVRRLFGGASEAQIREKVENETKEGNGMKEGKGKRNG